MGIMEDQLLTIDEVAEKLGLSGATVRRMVRNQEIGAVRVAKRQYRIPRKSLAEYIGANTTPRKPAASEAAALPEEDRRREGVGD